MTRITILIGLASIAGCDGRPMPATPTKYVQQTTPIAVTIPRPKRTFEADVAPLIARFCLECHDSASHRGGIILDDPAPSAETWGKVANVLRSESMPPNGRARPSSADRAAIEDWIDAEVFRCSGPGRVTIRRLNRAEYDNTIRDLLGLDLHLANAFPADDVGYGFDNIGDVLSIPPILMEKYLQAAGLAIEAARRSPGAWSRIMNPAPDLTPLALRKPVFEARNEPVKRIGRPLMAPVVEDPEVIALRQAREVLRGFADRAFRRPATADELNRLVGLVESARKDGDRAEEAIGHAVKAVLISPSFLFLVEAEPVATGDDTGHPINDFELAARLSYFLWSSLPDLELARLAVRGELRQGDNLDREVRRMLRDPKARALVDGFAAQWLQTRTLKEIRPDPHRFPDFDEPLRQAIQEETARFVESILLDDGRVSSFLVADYTFVNSRLARHYGIPGVDGDHFRKVSLAGTHRSGILTHASILMVTSNPTRTSPVKRGKWVLDNLWGMPPPPPPAGVEGLKAENGGDRPATLRLSMERHRDDPNCSSCHARMDPIGFSLENFDGIGAWRDAEEGRPIDDSGMLPGGESFRGPEGLRSVLIARRELFYRTLTEKLMTSALGRGLDRADRCFVEAIVRTMNQGDDRFSDLVSAIVASPPFQNRSRSRINP